MTEQPQGDRYVFRGEESFTRAMMQRSVETHAAFFLPHLKAGMRLLDWTEDRQSVPLAVAVPEFAALFALLKAGLPGLDVSMAEDRAFAGFNYVLPLFLENSVSVDSEGDFKFEIGGFAPHPMETH